MISGDDLLKLEVMPVSVRPRAKRVSRAQVRAVAASAGRFCLAAIFPALLLLLSERVPILNSTGLGLLLVLLTAVIARAWGVRPALVSIAISGAGFNYFLLPEHGPGHWVACGAFVAAILGTGLLCGTARRRHRQVLESRDEMEKLYRLANAVMESGNGSASVQEIADHLVEIFELSGVILFDKLNGQIARSGWSGREIPDHALHEIADRARPAEKVSGFVFTPIRSGDEVTGVVGISDARFSDHLLTAVAGRVAVGLARINAFERSAQAEISRRCEELKSAILDALAHEIRGPLNSIKIAVTSLAAGADPKGALTRELLLMIEEEADRMNTMIDDALQLSHVEAGELKLNRRPESVQRLVSGALDQISSRAPGRPIEVRFADSLPTVECDSRLLTKALKLLLDNALKYSPEGSLVTIAAECDRSSLLLKVANEGPGIPEEERALIFEKYYRGRMSRRGVPGTGLGLPSAKTIVEAHGGRIWVVSPPAGGAEFDVLLPLEKDPGLWPAQVF